MSGASVVRVRDSERREGVRHSTVFRVGVLHSGDAQELCLIKNISAGGLMAQVYRQVPVGEAVRIEMKTGHVLEGNVVWEAASKIGVEFPSPIAVEPILTTRHLTLSGARIRPPRIPVACNLKLQDGAGFHSGRLCNISQGGAAVRTAKPLRGPGSAVLMLPDLPPFKAVVQWMNGDVAGLSFNDDVALGTLVQWIQHRRRSERAAQPAAPPCS